MPGYDGTGPEGFGPLTGRGRGYCVLKVSGSQDETQIGYAGLSGAPITALRDFSWSESADLRYRFGQMRFALRDLNYRIEILKSNIGRKK
jgi:hypothetical protein